MISLFFGVIVKIQSDQIVLPSQFGTAQDDFRSSQYPKCFGVAIFAIGMMFKRETTIVLFYLVNVHGVVGVGGQ
jgi:hypothetical protein